MDDTKIKKPEMDGQNTKDPSQEIVKKITDLSLSTKSETKDQVETLVDNLSALTLEKRERKNDNVNDNETNNAVDVIEGKESVERNNEINDEKTKSVTENEKINDGKETVPVQTDEKIEKEAKIDEKENSAELPDDDNEVKVETKVEQKREDEEEDETKEFKTTHVVVQHVLGMTK